MLDLLLIARVILYRSTVTRYDRNGNITTLQRYGRTGASTYGRIDYLTLSYSGNRLSTVKDTGSAAYSTDFRYSNTTSTTYSYTHDAAGRMTKDAAKGISSITWNVLGLPETVTFSSGAVISYSYAADGTKLRESKTASGTTTTTDYTGTLVLEDGTRSRMLFDGGYISMSDNAYHFFLTDHVGSVRVVASASGVAEEYNHYYPLGGLLSTSTSSTGIQPLKYQGKEWAGAKGLNLYDFGARRYDPATGRWLSQDPLAEKYYGHSPYLFCAANPMRYVDPTGKLMDDYYSLINGKYLGCDAYGASARLIDPGIYQTITGGHNMTRNLSSIEKLRSNSTTISIYWDQIEEHAQSVADLSRESRVEHQSVIVLDRENALITSVLGPVGTNSNTELPYYPAPLTGVSYFDRPGGLIIIGEIHGHPASQEAGMSTEHTMSPNFDVPLAKMLQIPVYGIDAMYGKKGDSMSVHMVTPAGIIKNNVRRTVGKSNESSYSNWGLDALKLWGSSSFPQY